MTHEDSEAIKGPLIWLIMMLIVATALALGGCEPKRPDSVRHCNVLYLRGHAQPCRP